MKHSDRINNYLVKFNENATKVGWDDNSLMFQFYRGLPDRLKDQFSHHGKPELLTEMKTKAQEYDARYWARKEEKRRDSHNRPSHHSSTPKSDHSSHNSNKNQSSHNSSSTPSSNPRSDNQKASQSGFSSKPKHPNTHLNKEGKLSDVERKRRMDNKLCVICGESGHFRNNCPKRKGPLMGKAASVSTDSTHPLFQNLLLLLSQFQPFPIWLDSLILSLFSRW